MQIDGNVLIALIPLGIALMGLAFGYGALTSRVRSNKGEIIDIWGAIKDFQKDNKSDHNALSTKLDTIIRNGKKGG